ncbi:unnamed protein product [Paramecium octaurelia]|uniref:Uncharacterized protein n=1 Tax=Paramecium octaurelia TaxID=43137 RepID=A0A8S1RZ63_PAROT|nr:unnamed protein product [Paramecium octaurelia]
MYQKGLPNQIQETMNKEIQIQYKEQQRLLTLLAQKKLTNQGTEIHFRFILELQLWNHEY